MNVRVVLHLERLDSGAATWWAESTELPAFAATDASLSRLADLCEEAIAAEIGEADIEWSFAEPEIGASGPAQVESDGARDRSASEKMQLVLVAT